MKNSTFGRLYSRAYAARHKAYVRLFSGNAPYYLVNEFPKSGGTWFAQMLSAAAGLPFRRNQPIRFEPSVTHGHFLTPTMLKNVILVWRDPRDLIVSYYFHCYFLNEHNNRQIVALMKKHMPFSNYNDIQHNLPRFIEFISDKPISPSFSWPDFAKVWLERKNVVSTSYEALRADTAGELQRVLSTVCGQTLSDLRAQEIADAFSFEREKSKTLQADKEMEVSFLREGSLGGWKKHFTPEAMAMLENFGYHEPMKRLGYLK